MPNHEIKKLDNIAGVYLRLTAANDTKIPYHGFVECTVKLGEDKSSEFQVPFVLHKRT